MRKFARIAGPVLVLALGSTAIAQDKQDSQQDKQDKQLSAAPAAVQEVKVTGTAQQQRQGDTTGKVVVTQGDIARFGDTSVADVLRRVPGISVAGEIRMRGLGNGYTQILVNGDPVAPGFSIDSISPDLVERIEVMRAPTVEYSTQAIAGTINIILRRATRTAQRDVKLGMVSDAAGTTPNLTVQLSSRIQGFSYNLTGVAKVDPLVAPGQGVVIGRRPDGALARERSIEQNFGMRTRSLALTPRLNWTLDGGDTVASQSFIELNNSQRDNRIVETTLVGSPSEFPRNAWSSGSRNQVVRSDIAWTHNGAEGRRLSVKAGVNHSRRTVGFRYLGEGIDAARSLDRFVESEARDDQLTSSGKYAMPLFEGHAFVAGWDAAVTQRSEFRLQSDADGAGTALGNLDEHYDARVRRIAFFAQDEWDITPRWQFYVGLRWEGLYTDSTSNVAIPVHHRSGVWSPVLQSLWKLPGSAKDQVRLGVTRSYKAPTTPSLVPRRYTANNDNGPTNPDRQGNPSLRPELAWGLDLAFEHYFSKAGLLSASAFVRRIDDVTVERLYKEREERGVWIASPVNEGKATVHGIELEAALPAGALWPASIPVDVRFNLARNWSRLDAVPGPHNRLAQQVPVTANLGMDYRASEALTIGGNAGYQGAGPARISASLTSFASPQRTIDLYAVQRFSPRTQLRASAFNLLRQNQLSETYFVDPAGSTLRSMLARANRGVRVTLEHRF